jgi:hypothetical protein
MPLTGVRDRFLDDHARLRGKAEVLESLALRVLRGDEDLGSALRLKGEEILDHLDRHMSWEERELVPLLERSGAANLAVTIAGKHEDIRRGFETGLQSEPGAERRPLALARQILAFIRQLESDMSSEEKRVMSALAAPPGPDAGTTVPTETA